MTGSLLIHAKVLSKRANKMLICLAIVMLSANFSGCALSNDLDMPSSNFDEVITVPDPDSKTNELGHINVSTDSDDISKHNDSAIVQAKQTNPTKEKKAVSITISATGDCTIGINETMSYKNSFDEFYDKKGKSYFFRNVYDILSSDDFTIVNLEGPLTKSRDKQNKLYNHKGKPEYIDILTAGSIEAVSFSNNHSYDYGQSGYEETLSLLEKSGIVYASDNIYGIYETKGIKIGLVSVNELYDGKLVEVWLEEGIKSLKQQGANLIIACIHWGNTAGAKTSAVDEYHIELSKKCIDWGYDLIIGNHFHVLSGINKYKGKYIVYSLGNFCYGGSKNPKDKDTGIFQQTFTFVDGILQTDDNVKFIPCTISSTVKTNNYQPTIVSGKEAKRIIRKLNVYSAQFGVTFNHEGHPVAANSLNEQDKADAYFEIFKASLNRTKPLKSVKFIGVELSNLGLSDTTYLKSKIDQWCISKGFNVFFGTMKELVAAGYNKKTADGEALILLFDSPNWSHNQVRCKVFRNHTLLKYLSETYTSAYADGEWITMEGNYIQL